MNDKLNNDLTGHARKLAGRSAPAESAANSNDEVKAESLKTNIHEIRKIDELSQKFICFVMATRGSLVVTARAHDVMRCYGGGCCS